MSEDEMPPILTRKRYDAPSVFTPESLLREARRQKATAVEPVPDICLLDPDGDIVRQLKAQGRARRHDGWVCYHTDLYVFEMDGRMAGVVGCAVGSSFAVLVAEELFASGCKLLISVTSSGQLTPVLAPPYFVLIDRAVRDEGTSYHYLPPATYSDAPEDLISALEGAFDGLGVPVLRGATWTTDAPFRETEDAIGSMRERGLLAVEMEAAALYALAKARAERVICFAHVTNQMGQIQGDFEKGDANGAADALAIVIRTVRESTTSAIPDSVRTSSYCRLAGGFALAEMLWVAASFDLEEIGPSSLQLTSAERPIREGGECRSGTLLGCPREGVRLRRAALHWFEAVKGRSRLRSHLLADRFDQPVEHENEEEGDHGRRQHPADQAGF